MSIWMLQSKVFKGVHFNDSLFKALKEMKEKNLKPEGEKEITIDIKDLTKENIDLIMSVSNNFKILIDKNTFIVTEENCSKLMSLNKYIKDEYSRELSFPLSETQQTGVKTEVWNIDKVMKANSQVEEWTDRIVNARIDGKELSPFEKFLFAYRIVSHFEYLEEGREESLDLSRTVVGALNSNRLVCVGFADLLSTLCQRVGIECYKQDVACDGVTISHCNCCVRIDDDKYNIHGIYYSDPCWDSYCETAQNTLQHSLLKFDEVDKGFTRCPIAVKTEGLNQFKTSGKQVYTYQQLKDLAEKYTTKEQNEEMLQMISQIREKDGVEQSGNKELDLRSISDIFNYNDFFKPNKEDIFRTEGFEREIKRLSNTLQNMSDEKIAEKLNICQICLQCGNSYSELLPNEEGMFDKLNFELVDLVKNPTHVTKDMYIHALNNVYMSQGKTKEQAKQISKKIWENSVSEALTNQSIGNNSFSTAFIEECKINAKENDAMQV